ncbi:MAG: hypothetical protein DSM107014_15465 [Gomphosphaeria aponina SAG 52.96 = DSM 107014]|uniref:Protein TIC 20 n=1 Tax=Gomphosphaeria aponina SAG 52.96 = DSM 107014 TaxID=1521640 RepID=A0A941JVK5_9CHRO|nr:hypothetical protein [Gomphosphaeria aponina SAG 52.96 = DSM 107014]
MAWRGSIDTKDKVFGALIYILPLIYVLPYGMFLIEQFPILGIIYAPLAPIISIYYGFPFAGLIIFFVLFLAVVRNQNISHFIRFNTLQAILLDIFLILVGLVLGIVSGGLGNGNFLVVTLNNAIFLGILMASFYGIFQSAKGEYAEIPIISEAVYSQLPD